MEYLGEYDYVVVGAGHAGVEAALCGARLGVKVALFTISLDAIANMPCNPSIGGTAKGHLVREIDALGGEMGKAADATFLQSRVLNLGKGPAVHSLRVQSDRVRYHEYMKKACEAEKRLEIKQAEIVKILTDDSGHVSGVQTKTGERYSCRAAIIATGTYLNGVVHVGETSYESGPDATLPSKGLSASLAELGISLRRFKTGTPARVHKRSIDFSKLERQDGDENILPFSYETMHSGKKLENKVSCYISYTNAETHKIILDNLDRSPLFSGRIEGVGPRYCPSIEDKVVRFSDKPRHQLFIEPCGLETEEMYLQGLSSSLPEDVQLAFIHTIPGLEHVQVMRTAYAIEYDCVDPTALKASLEFNDYPGLFGAGQFNGSSGYEEAAAQGLVAGINAARKVRGEEAVVLDRGGSYIGTLIDDLVTKGCTDPYRMMTSRSEYRLVLRQDNADLRLTPLGHEIGLISDERYSAFLKKKEQIAQEMERIEETSVHADDKIQSILKKCKTTPLKKGCKMIELLKRPQVTYKDLESVDPDRPDYPPEVFEQVEISVKYEGYIARQEQQIKEMRRIERKKIPADLDYSSLKGLRLEAIEKLSKIRPENLGQASRISGVNPADIAALNIILEAL